MRWKDILLKKKSENKKKATKKIGLNHLKSISQNAPL
jgi:hypothetical protein